MKDICVLVTAAGNVYMPGTLSCLKNNGERKIRIIGADMSDDSTILQMCDKAYQVPRATDPEYIDSLLDICKKEKVDFLLPIMSAELEVLAVNKKRFEEIGTKVSVSSPEALHIANNKQRLLNYLKDNDLPCADFQVIHSTEELQECARKLGYPEKKVCVKAADSSGSRGFRILSAHYSKLDAFLHEKPSSGVITLEEMCDILRKADVFPELLLMEYLPGAEYTVDLLADEGKVLAFCCRKSLKMENSIMLDAVTVDNAAITDLCTGIVTGLKLDGNIGFDIRERSDGTPLIMECNPRITAGIPYYVEAGVNLPYLCIKKLLGVSIPATQPESGRIVRRRWMEMYA